MNKGEKLGILLDKADILHNKMNKIFLQKGLDTPDLTLISTPDREDWNKLYEQSKKNADEISNLING